ncbi:MAG: tetratricopeptide repeat protein [Chlamydiae bacterium]|nr:tetratricopeptide repeat protein [Chlamydiota bacterium]MBI3277991.1 tetratricopeptide repeat protein [Chlamydiota bacterium]
MPKFWVSLALLLSLVPPLWGEALDLTFSKGSLENTLFEDVRYQKLGRLSLEQAALIASGVSQRELPLYHQKIDALYNRIALSLPFKKLPLLDRAEFILVFLHQTVFKKYDASATEIQKTLDQGLFNCVSATLLFNILCERFHIKTVGLEIPTHLDAAVLDPGRPRKFFEVQTTIPLGFWVKDSTVNEFVYDSKVQTWKGKRPVEGSRLIAVIYYNRGMDWIRQNRMEEALPFYLKAYELDPHFPDLERIIAALYVEWGNQYFKNTDYKRAVEIYSEGIEFLKDRRKTWPILERNRSAALLNQERMRQCLEKI